MVFIAFLITAILIAIFTVQVNPASAALPSQQKARANPGLMFTQLC
jgi:hypothetical protein